MIDTEITGITKIIVSDLVQYTTDDFMVLMGGNPCLWSDGYLLAFNAVNAEEFDKSMFHDKIAKYRSVNFAIMEQYSPMIKTPGNVDISILNYSSSKLGKAMVKFIDDHREK